MKQLPPMRTGVKKSIHIPKHSSREQNFLLFQFFLAVGIDTSLNHLVTDLPTSVPRSSCNTAGNTPLGLKQHKKVHHMVELSPGWRARDRRPRVTAKQVEIMKPIRGKPKRVREVRIWKRGRKLLGGLLSEFKNTPSACSQVEFQRSTSVPLVVRPAIPVKTDLKATENPKTHLKGYKFSTITTTWIWSGLQWSTTFT